MKGFSEGEWWLHSDGRTIYAGRADEDSSGGFPWPGRGFVCEVGDTVEGLEGDDPIADANARLIAAARDMYAAAKALCNPHDLRDAPVLLLALKDAVRKAEGDGP